MDISKSNKESAVIASGSNNSHGVAGESAMEVGYSTATQSQPEDTKERDDINSSLEKRKRGNRQRMKRFRRKDFSHSVLSGRPSRYSSTPPSSSALGSEGSVSFDKPRLAEPIYRIARDRPSMECSLTTPDHISKNKIREVDLRAKLSQRQSRSKAHISRRKLNKLMKQQKKILKKLSSGSISANGITLNGNVYPNFSVSTNFNSVAQSSFAVHDGILGRKKTRTHKNTAPTFMSRNMNAVSTAANSSYLPLHSPVFNTEDNYSGGMPPPSCITLKGGHRAPARLQPTPYQAGSSAVALQNNLQYYNNGNFPNGMICFQNSDSNQGLNQPTSGSDSQVNSDSGLFVGNPHQYWYPAPTQQENNFQTSSWAMSGTASASNSGRTSICNEEDWQMLSAMLPYVSDEAHTLEETERDEVEEIHIFDDEGNGDLLTDCETADFIVQVCDVGRSVPELPANEDLGSVYKKPEPEYECGRFPSIMQTTKKDTPLSFHCSKPQIPHFPYEQNVEDHPIYENGSSQDTWTRRVEVVQGEMPAFEEKDGFSEPLPYTRIKNKALEVLCMLEDEESPIEAIKAVCEYMKWEVPIFQIAILSRDDGAPAKYCCKITAGSQSFGPYKAEKTESMAEFQAARKCMRKFKHEILQFLKGI